MLALSLSEPHFVFSFPRGWDKTEIAGMCFQTQESKKVEIMSGTSDAENDRTCENLYFFHQLGSNSGNLTVLQIVGNSTPYSVRKLSSKYIKNPATS